MSSLVVLLKLKKNLKNKTAVKTNLISSTMNSDCILKHISMFFSTDLIKSEHDVFKVNINFMPIIYIGGQISWLVTPCPFLL